MQISYWLERKSQFIESLGGVDIMNCWRKEVKKFDLVISEESDFDLTYDRVYVVLESKGFDLISIKNDLGEIDTYTTEYFRFYNGGSVES